MDEFTTRKSSYACVSAADTFIDYIKSIKVPVWNYNDPIIIPTNHSWNIMCYIDIIPIAVQLHDNICFAAHYLECNICNLKLYELCITRPFKTIEDHFYIWSKRFNAGYTREDFDYEKTCDIVKMENALK